MSVTEETQEDFVPRAMSLEEWEAMDEDEPGELVDDYLVEEEEVGLLHDVVVGWLISVFRVWLAARGGLVAASDSKFKVGVRRGRKPDVSVYQPGRRPELTGLVTVAPDIMIEVVSPRPSDVRRDRVDKTRDYAAFGVRYYWMLDPQVRTLEILGLTGRGTYELLLAASSGVLDQIPGCEGLTVDLDALWRELDELAGTA